MISAYLYETIYLFAVILLTVIYTYKYNPSVLTETHLTYTESNKDFRSNGTNGTSGYILATLFGIFIGFRPLHRVFVDMLNYQEVYDAQIYGKAIDYTTDTENIIFDNIWYWLGNHEADLTYLFLIMSLLNFIFTYKACTRLFPRYSILAFIAFLGAFSTFSYATNGIKAGTAAAFFLCALAYRDKPIFAGIYLFISYGFHHSMMMPIVAYICAWIYKNSKVYYGIWLLSLFIAFAHITTFQSIFAGLTDESGASYLMDNSDWGGKAGFRIDFVIYSSLPVIIGAISLFRYNLKSKLYEFVLNTYLLTNSVWMLCMYASFTNRIAYLSWLIYPIVLIFPFLKYNFTREQSLKLRLIVWFQLLFTLAMKYIYYA